MTVQTAETKTHYAGNGLTTEWPIPFPVVQEEHIKLIKASPDGEDEEITTGYTVNGMESGAVSITYPTTGEPLGAGWQLTIYRDMPLTQTLDLESGGAFDADVIERQGFDHLVMQIQQVHEQASRALQLTITDSDRTPDEVLGEMFELRDAAQQALASAQQALQTAQEASQTANDASQATQDAIVQVEQTLQETVQTVQDAQQALQGMEALMQEVETLAESLEELGDLGEILQEVQTALGEVQDALTALNNLGPGAATVSGFTPLAPNGWAEGWALTLAADGSTTYSAPPEIPASVPIGGIIMWSGSILDIPDRWLLCDGTHGTPNLLDRFVICAGLTYASGDVGGADTHTHTGSAAETTATGSISGTSLTIAQMPAHTHSVLMKNADSGTTAAIVGTSSNNLTSRATTSTGGGSAHTHTFTGNAHTHPINLDDETTLPPYYALAYIIRVF